MEEKTTTESSAVENTGESTQNQIQGVPVDEQGVAIPDTESSQPVKAEEEAVSQAEGTESTNQDSGEIDNSNQQQDDLAKWAANKGISVSTESERKLAEMARESEKAFHQKAQEASSNKMQETVSNADLIQSDDPVASELATIRSQLAITNFYAANPDARQYDEKMGEVLAEDPALLEYVRQTGNIDAVYKIARASDIESKVDELKNDGGREALTTLAAKQNATAIKGSATNTAPTTSNIDLDNMSRDEYIRLRDSGELNKILSR